MEGFSERVPPQDLDAEQAMLGACLIDDTIIPEVRRLAAPEDCYSDKHRMIFEAIGVVYDRKEPVDALTVHKQLISAQKVGVIPFGYLLETMQQTITTANATAYARIVADKSALRRIQRVARKIVDASYEAQNADELKAMALSEIQVAVFAGRGSEVLKPLGQSLWDYVEQAVNDRDNQKPTTHIVPTMFAEQDQRMPLERGTVTVVPSPSSMGKTTWMFNLLIGTARKNEPCLGFSLEMSPRQILQKTWANIARINTIHVRHQRLTDDEWKTSLDEAGKLITLPVYYAVKSRMRFADVRLEALAYKARHGKLSIVAVDYWQIIGDRPQRDERKDEMLGRLVEDAKDLAIECDCHVVILAQAKIDSNKPIPTLEDVKESRAIVAAADNILFLTRPLEFAEHKIRLPGMDGNMIECRCDDPDPNNPQRKLFDNVMLGIPGKARMGPKDIIPYYIDLPTGRMGDLAKPWPWANPRGIPRGQ